MNDDDHDHDDEQEGDDLLDLDLEGLAEDVIRFARNHPAEPAFTVDDDFGDDDFGDADEEDADEEDAAVPAVEKSEPPPPPVLNPESDPTPSRPSRGGSRGALREPASFVVPDPPAGVRVAVLGVPRSGTSLVVGLLRILGMRLPPDDYAPVCLVGEAKRLRRYRNSDGDRAYLPGGGMVAAIAGLPDGTVWKDPAVVDYLDRVDLRGWHVVQVVRDPSEVGRSEQRWSGQSAHAMQARAARWQAVIRARAKGHRPRLRIGMEEALANPVLTLHRLATFLGVARPSRSMEEVARAFVRPEGGGYACPLGPSCPYEHADTNLS